MLHGNCSETGATSAQFTHLSLSKLERNEVLSGVTIGDDATSVFACCEICLTVEPVGGVGCIVCMYRHNVYSCISTMVNTETHWKKRSLGGAGLGKGLLVPWQQRGRHWGERAECNDGRQRVDASEEGGLPDRVAARALI